VRARSKTGGVLQIRSANTGDPVIAQVEIPEGNEWNTIKAPLSGLKPGVQNLVVSLKDDKQVEIDWLTFK
jgi:hypothetical protein